MKLGYGIIGNHEYLSHHEQSLGCSFCGCLRQLLYHCHFFCALKELTLHKKETYYFALSSICSIFAFRRAECLIAKYPKTLYGKDEHHISRNRGTDSPAGV